MQLFFSGGETPTLRRRLLGAGAKAVSLNFAHLYPRMGNETFIVAEHFPDDVSVFLDSGGRWANENATAFEHDGWMDYLDAYLRLVVENTERLSGVTEFDFAPWGMDRRNDAREHFWDKLPEGLWLPVWHPEDEELADLCQLYPRVALTDVPSDEDGRRRVLGYHARYGTSLHGLGITRPGDARLFESMSSSSWQAAHRYGETPLWEGNRLTRHRADTKDEVRRAKAHVIARSGADPGRVAEDDPEDLTLLAVWAWQSWAEHVSDGATVSEPEPGEEQVSGTGAPEEEPSRLPVGTKPLTPAQQDGPRWNGTLPEGKALLPVMGLSRESDGSVEVTSTHTSLRNCDTCSLAGLGCPGFSPGAECSYSIPVEVRSKGQLLGVMRTMLEMQSQRVMFLRFAEELEGGHSKTLSAEMERLVAMTERVNDIQSDSSYLKMTVEARSGAGVLSQLFGSRTGNAASAIEPIQSDIIMAEVLGEDEVS